MSPTSSRKNQGISMSITLVLAKFLKDQDFKMYTAPFDVRLNDYKVSTGDNQIITAVQNNLCVPFGTSKLDDKRCLGAPDLVIKILSGENSTR